MVKARTKATDYRLSPEQWTLVTDNLPLVAWVRNGFSGVSLNWRQGLEDAALDGLIQAAYHYREGKSKFSYFAVNCMRQRCGRWLKVESRRPDRSTGGRAGLSHGRTEETAAVFAVAPATDLDDRDERDHWRRVLPAAVARLPAADAAAVAGVYLDGRTKTDVGRETGRNKYEVRQQLERALRKLRKEIGGRTQ